MNGHLRYFSLGYVQENSGNGKSLPNMVTSAQNPPEQRSQADFVFFAH
jgi:hypothetical protein